MLTLTLDPAAGAGGAVYYVAPDGALTRLASTVTGDTVSAALPHFSAFTAGAPYLTIGDVVTLEGEVTVGADGTWAGTGLRLFVGDGPLYLADGSLNPAARGLLITDATAALFRSGTDVAIDARGRITLIGVAGVALDGVLRVRVNETASAMDRSVTLPDGSGTVGLTFAAGEVAAGGTPFVAITADALTVAALGQTFTADAAITYAAGTGVTLGLSHVTWTLTAGAATVASLTGGSGSVTLGSDWSLAGTLALTVPGFTLTTSATLALSTANPADSFLRLAVGPTALSLAGQTLQVASLNVERTTVQGVSTTRVALQGGHLALAAGGTDLLVLDAIAGSLVVTADGLAGRLAATVTTAPTGFTLGTVRVEVNTGAAALGDLPAGPYVRVEALGASLAVAGQRLQGDIVFSRATTAAGASVVAVAVDRLAFAVSDGTSPLVSLSRGSGVLLLTTAGFAGSLTGVVAVSVPQVTITGELSVRVNTTGADVAESVTVGDRTVALDVPGGTGAFVSFAGRGVVVEVAGQEIRGDLEIATSGDTTTLAISGASLDLGGGVLSVTGASAALTLVASGLHGSFTGTPTLSVPGLGFTATVTVTLDTRPTIPVVTVTATGVAVAVGPLTLTADVTFKRAAGPGGVPVVRVAFANTDGATTNLLVLKAGDADLLTVADGSGELLLGTTAAGWLSLSGLTVASGAGFQLSGGALTLDVNTGAAPVTETLTVGGTTAEITLPGGPYVRVAVTGTTLILPAANLAASLAFERRPGGEVVVAASGVEVAVTVGGEGATLTGGSGAFLVTGGGLAGYVTGRLTAAAGPVAANGNVLLRINTTAGAVDETVEVGGQPLSVKFATGPVFEVSLTDASLSIGDFVTIEGSIAFTDAVVGGVGVRQFAGTGLSIFLGNGPARLGTGEINPLAVGVLLSDARLGLIGNSAGTAFALVASGTVSLLGVPGVVLTGTADVRVNTLGPALGTGIDTVIEIPGSTEPGVAVTFGTTDPVTEFTATATLAVAGQRFAGTFGFARDAGDTLITASGVTLSLGSAVALTDGAGTLLIGAAGLAGTLSGNLTVTVPGVTFGSGFTVAVNSTNAAVDRGSLTLPAGPYLRASAAGLSVTILGQTLIADVAVERTADATTITLADAALSLGAGDFSVGITAGAGLLVATAAGVAGRITGAVAFTLPTDVALDATLSLAVNTTTAPAAGLPAGPYLRFEATGAELTVRGQRIAGDVSFEKATDYGTDGVPGGSGAAADTAALRLAVANASLSLAGLVTLSRGSAQLLLTAAGLAGRITGDVALTVPGVSFSGALGLDLNTTGGAIDATFSVGSAPAQRLALPMGPFVRVSGTGLSLTVAGQTLAGDFVFTQSGATLSVATAGLALRLGGTPGAPLVSAVQRAGSVAEFVLDTTGLAGRVTMDVTLGVPGVTLGGTLGLEVNTTAAAVTLPSTAVVPAGPFVQLTGSPISVNLLGQSLSADVTIRRVTDAAGASVVTIGVANATLVLLPGTTSYARLTGGTGVLLLSGAGLAGRLAGSLAVVVPGVGFDAGSFEVQANTTGAAVVATVPVGGGVLDLDLPAGPYLRIAGTGVRLTVAGQSLSGNVTLEKSAGVLKLAATDVEAAFGDGNTAYLTLLGGEALFVVTSSGLAGEVSGTVALRSIPHVTLGGTLALVVNTTGGAVLQTFTVGGQPRTLDLPATPTLSIAGTDVVLVVAGQQLRADVTITKLATGVRIDLADGNLILGTPTAPLLRVTDLNTGTTGLTITTAGITGSVAGGVQFDVPSVSLAGAFSLELDTTLATPRLRVTATGATLTVGGFALGGNVVIERSAAGVALAFADVTLDLDGLVTVTAANHWTGAVLVSTAGVAASFTGALDNVFRLPGVTVGGTAALQLNTGTAPVDQTLTVATPGGGTSPVTVTVPGGPYVQVAVTGTLGIGGVSFAGAFLIRRQSQPTPETLIALTGVAVQLADSTTSDSLTLTNGQGLFVIVPGTAPTGGIAGQFSADVTAGSGGFSAGITVGVKYNATTAEVHRSVVVDGTTISLDFGSGELATASPYAPYVRVSGSGTIKLGDFIEVSGGVSFGSGATAVTDARIFVGQGPATLEGGAANPAARGVSITGANGAAQSIGGQNVFFATGTVALLGVPGVTATGTITVRHNPTGSTQTLTVDSQNYVVEAGTYVGATGLVLSIEGVSFTGGMSFTKSADGVHVTFTDVTASFGDGAPVTAGIAAADLTIVAPTAGSPAGIFGYAIATIDVAAAGIAIGGVIDFRLNTTATARDAGGVTLPGHTLAVQVDATGAGHGLVVADQTLQGVFSFEQENLPVSPQAPAGTQPPKVVRVAGRAITLVLGTPTAGVSVTEGTAAFLLTGAGFAGRIGGRVAVNVAGGSAVTFTGDLSVAINTGSVAVNQTLTVGGQPVSLVLPKGPYLRVEGLGIVIGLLGQQLTGDLVFEKSGTTVVLAATGVSASLGDGVTPYVSLTNGSGVFVLTPGFAGEISGKVALTVPGVTLTGTFGFQVNNGTAAAATTVTVGGQAVTLNVPGGPFLQVGGTGVTLTVAGVALRGGFTFRQATAADGTRRVDIALDAVTLDLGALGDVAVTGSLALRPAGLAGALTLGAALTLPGVTLGGSLGVQINNTAAPVTLDDGTPLPAGPYLRVVGDPVTLTFGTDGPQLTASVSVTAATNAAGQRRTVVGVAGGSVRLNAADAPLLTGVAGLIVVAPDGVAATLAGTLDAAALLPAGVTVAGTFALSVNTAPRPVAESLTLGGVALALNLPSGSFVRVAGTGVTLNVMGQRLTGNLAVQKTGTRTVIAFTDVTLRLGDGTTDLVVLSGGRGGFAVAPTGLSGSLTGSVALTIPDVTLTGAISLEINTAAAASGSVVIDVGGTPLTIATGGAQRFRLGGSGVALTVAGQRLAGEFWVEQVVTGTTRTVRISAAGVTLFLGDAAGTAATDDDTGVLLSGGSGQLLLTPTGLATSLTGTLAVVVPSGTALPFTLGATTASLQLNTRPTAVNDSALGLALPAGRFVRVTIATDLEIAGQSLGGTFAFEQARNAGADGVLNTTDDRNVLKVGATGVHLFVGASGYGLDVSDGEALFLMTRDGLAGRVSAHAELLLGDLLDPVSADVTVSVNNLRKTTGSTTVALAANETFVLGGTTATLSLPAGSYVKVAVTGVALVLQGQRLTADVAVERAIALAAGDVIPTGATPTTSVRFANVSLRLGTTSADFVTVSGGHGAFTIFPTAGSVAGGLAGRLVGAVAVTIPGVTVAGAFELRINTTGAPRDLDGVTVARGLTVAGTGVSLSVAGQTLSGSFTFVKSADGTTLDLGLLGVSLALGTGAKTLVTLTIASGALRILPQGIAGSLTASAVLDASLSSAVDLTGLSLRVDVNTTTVRQQFTIGVAGTAVAVDVPAGPYVRVQAGTEADPVSLAVLGQRLAGVVLIEQRTTAARTRVVTVAFTHVSLFLGDPGADLDGTADDKGFRLTGGAGVWVFTPGGVAGEITGAVETVGFGSDFSISGTLGLQVNNTAVKVAETVTFTDAAGAAVTRALALPAGPYVRLWADDFALTIAGLTITADLALERVSAGAGTVTRIGFAHASLGTDQPVDGGTNPGLSEGQGALFLFSPGATTATGVTTTTGGLAGTLLGHVAVAGDTSFSADGTVGFQVNTTGVAVDQSLTVGGTAVTLKMAASPTFLFVVQDLAFDFGDLLEVRAGSFTAGGGTFSGTGLELFVGSGPSKLADGSDNPRAIGVLITNATLEFRGTTGAYAILASGTLRLLGLDGLTVEGTVTRFAVNTGPSAVTFGTGPTAFTAQPGVFSFLASGVRFAVPGVVDLSGTLGLTRQPNGTLDVYLNNLTVLVGVGGTDVAKIVGYGSFTISPATGFRLNNVRVDDFALFPKPTDTLTPDAAAPTLFPTADLGGPVQSGVYGTAPTSILVRFNDLNGVGLRPETITDTAAEFEVLVDGATPTQPVTIGQPEAQPNRPGWYRYSVLGLPASGLITVRFLPGAFSDVSGAMAMGADQSFVIFVKDAQHPTPGPVVSLANPANGSAITVAQLNAQGYVDVTYTSLPPATGVAPDPIDQSLIRNRLTAPFKLSGTALADVKVDASGYPELPGAPVLISGRAEGSTTVTYRYFFKDKLPTNGTGLFASGWLTLAFDANVVRTSATTPVYNTAQTLGFTVDASAPGAATKGGPVNLGPLTLQGPSVGLADFGFADGMVVLTIALGVDRAGLAFGSGAQNTGTTAAQTNSGVTVDLLGVMGTFDLAVDVFGLLSGNVRVEPTGKWSLRAASLAAHIPDVADLTATGIEVGYDPKGAADQELVRLATATLTIPRFGITGTLRPYNPGTGQNVDETDLKAHPTLIPGLVVRQNGFTLGTAELRYGPTGTNTLSPTGADPAIKFGDVLTLDDIRVGLSGFKVDFDGSNPFADFDGEFYIATGGAKLFPGRPYGATLKDRLTADDRNPDGTSNDEAFRITLTFSAGEVDDLILNVDTLELRLGSFLTLTTVNFTLNTGASGTSAELVSFGSVGATVSIGSLAITGEGRNFAITGTGDFVAKAGFGVFLAVGSASGESFQWPSWMPVRIDAIGVQWADVSNHPEDFVLTLSLSVTGIQGLSALEFSGSIVGVKIQPSLLAQGKFPIIEIAEIGVRVKGDLFGGKLDAGLVGGIIKLDANYAIIGVADTTAPVFKRVFCLGIEGGFAIAGMAGLTIRLGLSELGPLQVFLNVEVPGGVMLVPQIGLVMNDFAAGVEFFKSLPSLSDPFALRGPVGNLPSAQTADQWMQGLRQQVAAQAKTLAEHPEMNGFFAAFTAPMTITGSARVYSIYTSQQVFNGQVVVKISTDGKLLIIGKLNFAANQVSLSGRLYVDLSKVATGNATVLFLADIPDQVRVLTLYGKLRMGFRDSSGNEVTFDVVDLPSPEATATAPTASVVLPAADGASIDVGVANLAKTADNKRYVDVTFTAPAGASIDSTHVLDAEHELELVLNGGTPLRPDSGTPIPIVTVTADDGFVYLAALVKTSDSTTQCTSATNCKVTYSYRKFGATADTVVTVVDLANEPAGTSTDVLNLAIRRTGTNRYRYVFSSLTDWPIGTAEIRFLDGAVKNVDLVDGEGNTTPGATSAPRTATVRVTGTTAVLADPTDGSNVDLNVINHRPWQTWLDVVFTAPGGRTIVPASVLDLAPELVLGGAGLGTAALDANRTPTVLAASGSTLTVRFWITGAFADAGAVTVTPIAGSWSFAAAAVTVTTVTLTAAATPAALTITLTLPAGTASELSIDVESLLTSLAFVDADPAAPGVQLYAAGGWIVTLDATRAITRTGTGATFVVPVVVTAGAADATFTPAVTAASVPLTSTADADYAGAVAVQPVAVTGTPTAYLDVTFRPSAGSTLTGSVTPDVITLGGFGAAGVTVLTTTPIRLEGDTYRFLLAGAFVIGAVDVTVDLTRIADTSGRSPPGTAQTLRFTVVGATGDLVRTLPDGAVVALGGQTIGRDRLNATHYLEVRFTATSGATLDHNTIDSDELQLRGPSGDLIALAGATSPASAAARTVESDRNASARLISAPACRGLSRCRSASHARNPQPTAIRAASARSASPTTSTSRLSTTAASRTQASTTASRSAGVAGRRSSWSSPSTSSSAAARVAKVAPTWGWSSMHPSYSHPPTISTRPRDGQQPDNTSPGRLPWSQPREAP
nr:hypothetical protein [Propionibacterium sp.]